jgi:uroporphyrinogen-III synthase
VAESSPSPLLRKKVVVTRAALQNAEISRELAARGGVPISLPLVSFAEPEDWAPMDSALAQVESFDWVIFTSANSVRAAVDRQARLGQAQMRPWNRGKVATVGPATADEAKKNGISVDYVAKTQSGAALAEELSERVGGKSVFLPRSDRANPDLPMALRRCGAKVTEAIAYRTLLPDGLDREKVDGLVSEGVDAIVFYSPSAVHHFAELAGWERLSGIQDKVAVVAVGPVTAEALRECGVESVLQAAEPSTGAVVTVLQQHFAARGRRSIAGVKRA